VHPDRPPGAELVDVGLDALAGLVVRTAELRSSKGSAQQSLHSRAGRLLESGTALGRRLAQGVRARTARERRR
jgi:hypothetical protein